MYCCLDGVFGGPSCFGGMGRCDQLVGCTGTCRCWDTRIPVYGDELNQITAEISELGVISVTRDGKTFILIEISEISSDDAFQIFYDQTLDLYTIKRFSFTKLFKTHSYSESWIQTYKVKIG